jgi:hypothetical protein
MICGCTETRTRTSTDSISIGAQRHRREDELIKRRSLNASDASAARRSPAGPRHAFLDGGLEASINATVLGF